MAEVKVPSAKPLRVNGTVLVASPIGLGDLFEHANYARMLYLEEQKKRLIGLPDNIAEKAWERADRYADKITPGSEEYQAIATWFEAQVYLVYLTFRGKHPHITVEDVRKAMNEQYPDLMELANEMAGFVPGEEVPLAPAVAEQPTS